MAGQALLIRAHGPSGILLIWSNGNQARVGWELALSAPLLECLAGFSVGMLMPALVEMAVLGGLNGCDEQKECRGARRKGL